MPSWWSEFEAEAIRLITGAGIGQAKDRVRRLVDRMNPDEMVERHKKARAERDVTLEPGANGMAWLHMYLPAVEAVAIRDRLTRAAIALHGEEGEDRCIGQLRADVAMDLLLAVCRRRRSGSCWTGSRRNWVPITIVPQVHVTVPVMTLLGQSNEPGYLRGYGPIDPETARRLTAQAPSLYRVLVDPGTRTRSCRWVRSTTRSHRPYDGSCSCGMNGAGSRAATGTRTSATSITRFRGPGTARPTPRTSRISAGATTC